jgi:uncharacterized protein YigA (DUF484 family)
MSSQSKPDYSADTLTEQTVHDFLEDHPDFFERHSSLLGALRLPHVTGGTVSLVERQVSVLRQKDLKLERRLKDLLKVARANDVLAGKIHQLSIALLGEKTLEGTLTSIEQALRVNFDAEQSVLVLFGDAEDFAAIDKGRFFRTIERDDDALGAFSTFLESDTPRCGQIRDSQRDFLFPGNGDEVGSVALVPLGRQSATGFLAIGSVDARRFHPGMSIDFLARIGEMVTAALCRF